MKKRPKKFILSKIDNPYSIWDTMINPKYLIWERYKEIASVWSDERAYSSAVLPFLKKHGELIEEITVTTDTKELAQESEILRSFYDLNDHSSYKFWYKNTIVCAQLTDQGHYTISITRPISIPFPKEDFAKFLVKTKGDSKVSILVTSHGGLTCKNISFPPPKIDDLEFNYGTGFNSISKKIVDKLEKSRGGLMIFHGPPGTGKSSYIKYLTSVVSREFIFIPVNMTSELASPSLISTLLNHKDAILVLEDAEQSIRERGTNGDDSIVSTLLNVTDGILGNVLRFTLIVTWNMDRQFVDKALLRKGRLIYEHVFSPLNVSDAERLSKNLGFDKEITKPMTLAEIYNQDDGAPSEQEKKQETVEKKILGFSQYIESKSKN